MRFPYADQRSEERIPAAKVGVEVVEAQDDVAGTAVAVGRVKRDDGPAISHDGGFNAARVRQV